MTQFKIHGAVVGVAALLASALATPAMAQQMMGPQARCADANCQTMRTTDANYHHRVYRQDRGWQDSYNRYDSGSFWPADVAAGVVGGAVGTAAAIAAAPMGVNEYARLNGFVCTPGTWFRGQDGLLHPCQ